MGRNGLIIGALGAALAAAALGPSAGLLILGGVLVAWAGGVQRRLDAAEAEIARWRAQAPGAAEATPTGVRADGSALSTPPVGPVPPPRAAATPVTLAPAPTVAAAAAAVETSTVRVAIPVAPAAAAAAPQRPAPVAAAPARHVDVDEASPRITSSLGQSIQAWFTGGNTIVRVAVVILFIGVAFLLRYAAEHAVVPIELRLAAVALGGVVLAGIGWRLREKRRGYGLSLQGAGIGVLYLTLFASMKLYGLLPPGLAFALLAVLAATTALLAVWQDALPLAVLGFAGGFLAPVLTSDGSGNHVMLFSYDLLLNLAIAWIAGRKAWKLLNLLGFVFTFAIGLGWGLTRWEPALLASTEPFLIAHVALYLWICIGYSKQLAAQPAPKLPYVDGGLLFGLPVVAFGLQAAMVKHIPYGLAVSAAVMSAAYLVLGRWLWRTLGERLRLLTEGMLALGVIFLAMIAPLALDARWTAAAWALQGAGMVWVALRQQRAWALLMGLLLQAMAGLKFWGDPASFDVTTPFLNAPFVGALWLALAALATARGLALAAEQAPKQPARATGLDGVWAAGPLQVLHAVALAVGTLHSVAAGGPQIGAFEMAVPDEAQRWVIWLAGLAVLGEALHVRLRWPAVTLPARALFAAALGLSAALHVGAVAMQSTGWGRLWPEGLIEIAGLLLVARWLLKRLDIGVASRPARGSLAVEHLIAGWYTMLVSGLAGYTLCAEFAARHEAWTVAAVIVGPSLIGLAVLRAMPDRWPVAAHATAWWRGLVLPWAALSFLWVLVANAFADGAMAPLPYLPLLNPIDLGHGLLAVHALRAGQQAGTRGSPARRALWLGTGAAGFIWLNGLLVRSLHHWAGTPMWIDGALDSGLVQTGLSVLWTVTALATMAASARRAGAGWARPLWLAGAALLAVVVAKLLLVDLSHTSALQRIISFMGVGVLMLVIGYLAPMPPARREEAAA